MKKTKRILTMTMAMLMAGSMSMTSLAAGWQQNEKGKWWQNDDGTWPTNSWQWLDGNNDGVAECYYFDGNGYMLANTKTPDGYTVDGNGAWVVNGAVQTKAATGTGTTNTAVANGNYDPAHPLANVVDTWNLRLVDQASAGVSMTNYPIGLWNVHAMLTNQMDKYVTRTAGWTVNPVTGNRVYTEQADIDKWAPKEQALYNWFCNWLNSMDFQNMSEMQRAQEIKKVLLQARYDQTYSREGTYSILIDKSGACSDFASAAISMAKALGLKCASYGGNGHEYYYIWVDGVKYRGDNQILNLNQPAPDNMDPWITPMN